MPPADYHWILTAGGSSTPFTRLPFITEGHPRKGLISFTCRGGRWR
uniref:Uncharacterized protein n=1 Tax=Oryza punctata TaxID=4537 RepID=A0A0E0LV42_ORYPU